MTGYPRRHPPLVEPRPADARNWSFSKNASLVADFTFGGDANFWSFCVWSFWTALR